MISRTDPSSCELERNVRKANIQPRLLRAACVVFETESTTNGASTRARVTADEVVVIVAITAERFDKEAGATTGSGDYRNLGDYEGRAVCQSQGYIHWCGAVDMREFV
jgi:hypothetical protein